jgi:cytochrome bd-I ubiquinol oxidase subunit X
MGCGVLRAHFKHHVLGYSDYGADYCGLYQLGVQRGARQSDGGTYSIQSTQLLLRKIRKIMWYFAWILGLGLAVCLGIINVMWLEADYTFGARDEDVTRGRFEAALKEGDQR